MNERDLDEQIAGYIRRYTQPIQWVGWCLGEPGPGEGGGLHAVLFDPATGALRDLTEPSVREGVIGAVLESGPLRQLVGEEVARFLGEVAEVVAARLDRPDGR
jgi:hypothetical protein